MWLYTFYYQTSWEPETTAFYDSETAWKPAASAETSHGTTSSIHLPNRLPTIISSSASSRNRTTPTAQFSNPGSPRRSTADRRNCNNGIRASQLRHAPQPNHWKLPACDTTNATDAYWRGSEISSGARFPKKTRSSFATAENTKKVSLGLGNEFRISFLVSNFVLCTMNSNWKAEIGKLWRFSSCNYREVERVQPASPSSIATSSSQLNDSGFSSSIEHEVTRGSTPSVNSQMARAPENGLLRRDSSTLTSDPSVNEVPSEFATSPNPPNEEVPETSEKLVLPTYASVVTMKEVNKVDRYAHDPKSHKLCQIFFSVDWQMTLLILEWTCGSGGEMDEK